MAKFQQQVTKLNERQLRIAVFVFLRFSDTTIAYLFKAANSTVIRQVRYRIRKKIKDTSTADSHVFLE